MTSMLATLKNARLRRIPADTTPDPTIEVVSPDEATTDEDDVLSVSGTGFMSDYGMGYVEQVYFGATPATSFTVINSELLTAVAPGDYGVFPLIVRTSGGQAVYVVGNGTGSQLLTESGEPLITQDGEELEF